MKRFFATVITVPAFLCCVGCYTTDQAMLQLKEKNRDLIQQLAERENSIKLLKNDKEFLQKELAYFTKRSSVLEKEKEARMEASAGLRQGIREFTDNVMNSLRSYYQKTELVDYIGSELFPRSVLGDDTNKLLIDLEHPLEADGTLIGGSAYISAAPTRLVFCLVRPVAGKPERYQVVRVSDPQAADRRGMQNWTFQVPLAGKKGDCIGVFFPELVAVPYDDADTGNVALVPGPVQAGDNVRVQEAEKRNKRAYSFGMTGFLSR